MKTAAKGLDVADGLEAKTKTKTKKQGPTFTGFLPSFLGPAVKVERRRRRRRRFRAIPLVEGRPMAALDASIHPEMRFPLSLPSRRKTK